MRSTQCGWGGDTLRVGTQQVATVTRTLINSLEPEEARQRSSVDKTWVPHDRLRNVSGMLLALKVIFPTLVGPLRANV